MFLRFGYRNTSMHEVARAAGLSRQGSYLRSATEQALFHAVIERMTTVRAFAVDSRRRRS